MFRTYNFFTFTVYISPNKKSHSYRLLVSKLFDFSIYDNTIQEHHQYKFFKSNLSAIFHDQTLYPSDGDLVTFLRYCNREHQNEDSCHYVEVKDKFNEIGYVAINLLQKDPIKYECSLCNFKSFDEGKYYDHLCLDHFWEDLKEYLEYENKCAVCSEDIESLSLKEKILHYGSGSIDHRKVIHLMAGTKVVDSAIKADVGNLEDKIKALNKHLDESTTENKDLKVQFEEKIKQNIAIEDKVKALNKQLDESTTENKDLKIKIEVKNKLNIAIEKERDSYDEVQHDFCDRVSKLLGTQERVNQLDGAFTVIETYIEEKNNFSKNICDLLGVKNEVFQLDEIFTVIKSNYTSNENFAKKVETDLMNKTAEIQHKMDTMRQELLDSEIKVQQQQEIVEKLEIEKLENEERMQKSIEDKENAITNNAIDIKKQMELNCSLNQQVDNLQKKNIELTKGKTELEESIKNYDESLQQKSKRINEQQAIIDNIHQSNKEATKEMIEKFQTKMQKMSYDNDELIEGYIQHVEEKNEQIESLKLERAKINTEKTSLGEENMNLTRSLKEKEEVVNNLKHMEVENNDLKRKHEAKMVKFEKIVKEKEDMESKFIEERKSMSSQVTESEGIIENLMEMLKERDTELEKLKGSIKDIKASKETLFQENIELSKSVKDLNDNLINYKQINFENNTKLIDLETQKATEKGKFEARINKIEAINVTLSLEKIELSKSVNDLKKKLTNFQNNTKLNDLKKQHEDEKDKLEAIISVKETEMKNMKEKLETEFEDLKVLYENLKDDHSALCKDNGDLRNQLFDECQEKQSLETKYDEMEKERDDLDDKNQELIIKLQSQEEASTKLTRNYDAMKNEYSKTVKNYEQSNEKLKFKLNKLIEEILPKIQHLN